MMLSISMILLLTGMTGAAIVYLRNKHLARQQHEKLLDDATDDKPPPSRFKWSLVPLEPIGPLKIIDYDPNDPTIDLTADIAEPINRKNIN